MHRLVDTHAHLDEIEDLGAMIERARNSGLIAIIGVGVDYESNNRILEIAEKYRSFVFPALGLHPQEMGKANSDIEWNLRFIEENIEKAVAVGEIGLDYHKKVVDRTSKDTQKQILKDMLRIAKCCGRPASLHSRYAWRDCFTCVRESGIERTVFHWYTGPMNVLREFVSEGHLASATLAVGYHEEHRRTVKETPLENLMLETDSPVVYRWGTEFAHQSEPADVANVVFKQVAKLKGVEPDLVAQKTTENAIAFFNLSNMGVK